MYLCVHVPPVGGIQFGRHHVQWVPGRYTESVIKAEHRYHHGLTGAEPQKETTDAGQHHRAAWTQKTQSTIWYQTSLFHLVFGESGEVTDLTCSDGPLYPWGGRRLCCLATRLVFQGSWWNTPSTRCSRHQTSSDSRSCCAQTWSWSQRNWWISSHRYLNETDGWRWVTWQMLNLQIHSKKNISNLQQKNKVLYN